VSEHQLEPQGFLDQSLTEYESASHMMPELSATTKYEIYSNEYPFLRQYDDTYYNESGFGQLTETKSFGPDLFQDMIASEYSDQVWGLSLGKR